MCVTIHEINQNSCLKFFTIAYGLKTVKSYNLVRRKRTKTRQKTPFSPHYVMKHDKKWTKTCESNKISPFHHASEHRKNATIPNFSLIPAPAINKKDAAHDLT